MVPRSTARLRWMRRKLPTPPAVAPASAAQYVPRTGEPGPTIVGPAAVASALPTYAPAMATEDARSSDAPAHRDATNRVARPPATNPKAVPATPPAVWPTARPNPTGAGCC